ncbi:hypothetical protein D1Y84_09620 [Acidipila sp. EB88]|nr:hypothetical protein D1Y84_09620 [Acidipila sp. EB88]
MLTGMAPLQAQIPAPAVPAAMQQQYARDPHQAVDQAYTAAIAKDTTEPYFNSSLTDYLPASNTVPTPAAVLGDIAGAPGKLPYSEDVTKYFRLLASKTPRVKVFSIGKSEEGREMIAAAVGDASLLEQMDANNARLAQLADPRKSGITDEQAATIAKQSFPVYYITGTIHSPETGAPTALMELAYRLAVDDSPYIQYIRQHMVVLITPVVEVDGRDRMVDVYKWHLAHPNQTYPRLVYWGHYVAHDNNRDAMAMTLALTQHVLDTFLNFHAQVLHDLHESVPFLYDNTVGDGPYNAWIDPLLADEWAALGWNNVGQMQNFGMPGVFTHGEFDTWSPGYLMFLAGMHNGISRLYETFGNGGADTVKRILTPDEYARTWYRQNPPNASVLWSQRDNNNYEQSALLSTLSYFVNNREHFLDNYYLKAKRSIAKPTSSGPAAYVLAADPAYRNRQLALLRTLSKQHVEISQLTEAATVLVSAADRAASLNENAPKPTATTPAAAPTQATFAAGSWVVRMDQPYARAADALLDRQYWSPDDPQKTPYDDTAWSFSLLFNAKVTRVTDPAILRVPMRAAMVDVADAEKAPSALDNTHRAIWAFSNTGQINLLSLVYAYPKATFAVLDEPATVNGTTLAAGSMLVSGIRDADTGWTTKLHDLGLEPAASLASLPTVKMHTLDHQPRIAMMHTWLATQTEGWWREAFDTLGIPYSYISTQTAAGESDLRSKYDVIVFAPVTGRTSAQSILDGLPMYGNPLPWQTTALTPNLGRIDATADMRPGLGTLGLEHLRSFVRQGGLLITSEDSAQFAIASGLAPGVSVAPTSTVKLTGSILGALTVKPGLIAAGYSGSVPVYSASGLAFNVSNTAGGGNAQIPTEKNTHRVTGRGGPNDEDAPEDRTPETTPVLPSVQAWQPVPLNEEQLRNNPFVIPENQRPEVVLRFADTKNLLLSGLLENPEPLAAHAAVVDAHLGTGNVLLFAIDPIYRGETIGTYALVFNAIMNYDHLTAAPAQTIPNAAH